MTVCVAPNPHVLLELLRGLSGSLPAASRYKTAWYNSEGLGTRASSCSPTPSSLHSGGSVLTFLGFLQHVKGLLHWNLELHLEIAAQLC